MNPFEYRKKPAIVEAFQMTPARHSSNYDWPEWLHKAWNEKDGDPGSLFLVAPPSRAMGIGTLEGILLVNENDWIIRGVAGELYPCKPEIFEATYEKV